MVLSRQLTGKLVIGLTVQRLGGRVHRKIDQGGGGRKLVIQGVVRKKKFLPVRVQIKMVQIPPLVCLVGVLIHLLEDETLVDIYLGSQRQNTGGNLGSQRRNTSGNLGSTRSNNSRSSRASETRLGQQSQLNSSQGGGGGGGLRGGSQQNRTRGTRLGQQSQLNSSQGGGGGLGGGS